MKELAIVMFIVGVTITACSHFYPDQPGSPGWTAKDLYSVMVKEGVIRP